MNEQSIVNWFAMHSFTRNELLMMLGGVSAMAKADWTKFQNFKIGDNTAVFKWKVAILQYLQGALIGGLPPLVAEIYHVLGAS